MTKELPTSPDSLQGESEAEQERLLSDIEPVSAPYAVLIKSRDEIAKYVDPPLIPPCQELYDKNIRTVYSSAASDDVGKKAKIALDTSTLSDENLAVCRKIEEEKLGSFGSFEGPGGVNNFFQIAIPVDSDISSGEATRMMMSAISPFLKQPLLWGSLTLEQIKRKHLVGADVDDPEEISRSTGFSYDPEEDVFYRSEELFRKAQEF